MKRLLTIISIILFSCQEEEIYLKIPDYVRPHYEQFFIEAEKRGVNINEETLFFEENNNLENNALARADTRNNTILINILKFEKLSYSKKEHLIFHELGHYLLRRQHNNDLEKGTPVSIMYWHTFSYKEDKRDNYLDELFKP